MNWRLTRDSVGKPQLEDWSDWRILSDIPQLPILDVIYNELEEQGKNQGVTKVGPGRYIVKGGGWLFGV
jgi:hypothetical protein